MIFFLKSDNFSLGSLLILLLFHVEYYFISNNLQCALLCVCHFLSSHVLFVKIVVILLTFSKSDYSIKDC